MSTGEQLADLPDKDPQDPFDFIEEFREKSERVKTSLAIVTANPSRESMADLRVSIAEVQESVLYLYNKDFFKSTKSPLVVSTAISALTDSVRDTMACIKDLAPDSTPKVEITLDWNGDPEDAPQLVISLEENEDVTALGESTNTAESVNEFANLILEGDAKRADSISKQLARASETFYEFLENNLSKDPGIQAYLEREARHERYKELAMKGGGIAMSAFAGTLLANLISRKRK